jgi:hypothetical protein
MVDTVPPAADDPVKPKDVVELPASQVLPGTQPPTPSVVTTQEATLTFAAAPAAVNIVWNVLAATFAQVAHWTWFPMVLSLIVGMAIYYLSPSSGTGRQKVIAFFFALVNSFTIAATALGIDTAVTRKTDTVQAATQTQSKVPTPAHVESAAKQ